MAGFLAFHMQDPGQCSISTNQVANLQLQVIDKRLECKSNTDLDIVKMEAQVTLSEKFGENDFHL